MFSFQPCPLLFLLPCLPGAVASALPAKSARPALAAEQQPIITPSPASWHPTQTYKVRRDIFDDLKSKAEEKIGDVLSDLGNVPGYVASGIPNFFQDFPGVEQVRSSLGIDDDQLAALPTQVLNVPWVASVRARARSILDSSS